jgi:hypothetical protein
LATVFSAKVAMGSLEWWRMETSARPAEKDRLDSVELAKYLWEEYKYRHDLIWRLLFRVTAVAAVLSIAPFTIDDLTETRVGGWVKFLPVLAAALIFVSWLFLLFEFQLFAPINKLYVDAQKCAVGQSVRGTLPDFFKLIVIVYPLILLVLTVVVSFMAWSLPRG